MNGRHLLHGQCRVKMATGYNNEVKKVKKQLTPGEAIGHLSKIFPEWKDVPEEQVVVNNIS